MTVEGSIPDLCVVMPTYNEQDCIVSVVQSWLTTLDKTGLGDTRLVIVNDGSKDRTGELLDDLREKDARLHIIHQENSGHGCALRNAYEEALKLNAKWVFHVDSDDQFFAEDFLLLWEQRDKSPFLLGYRKNRYDALHRLVLTRIVRAFNLLLFGKYIKDANIPFRLIEGTYLKHLLAIAPSTVFAPNIFLSMIAVREGKNLMHIPVRHKDRATGEVSIIRLGLLLACLRCVKELLLFRFSKQPTASEGN